MYIWDKHHTELKYRGAPGKHLLVKTGMDRLHFLYRPIRKTSADPTGDDSEEVSSSMLFRLHFPAAPSSYRPPSWSDVAPPPAY